jgi:Uri superfamily endonuclease
MQSYQLFITLSQSTEIQIGKLGLFAFPNGTYVYTGSAKKNIDARIERHLSKNKTLHWHIDYLLASEQSQVIDVIKSRLGECKLNAETIGKVLIAGFGSSDCNQKCRSHLKYNGSLPA